MSKDKYEPNRNIILRILFQKPKMCLFVIQIEWKLYSHEDKTI